MSTDPKPTGAGDGSDELLIPYPGTDARHGMLFGGSLAAAFAAGSVGILIVMWRNSTGSHEDWAWGVPVTVFVICGAALTALLSAHILTPWWRITRGAWWLRLSASGLEINERLGRPQRYQWRDFERFFLVPTPADLDSTELAPRLTFSEKFAQGINYVGPPVLLVGLVPAFQLVPTYPRNFWHKRRNHLYRTFDGPTPDGFVVEYWDRPFDQAVDLLNEWLIRHRNT